MPLKLSERLVHYEDLHPCKAAFIDAKTPGSHLKDNFSIIGAGVTESKEQIVNIKEKHGFNIGGAGQPPKIKNSLHSHFTAEVFIVHKGEWLFYWNNDGETSAILKEGDIINLPTNMFRGFENVGNEYGMLFSILGRDDAGGGVVWAPKVIEAAKGHGLILLENGKLVDTTKGETVPEGMKPKSKLTEEELKTFDTYTVEEMLQFVMNDKKHRKSPCKDFPNQTPETLTYVDVIGPKDSKCHDFVIPGSEEGFNVFALITEGQADTGVFSRETPEVLMVHRGNFEIECDNGGEHFKGKLKDGDIYSFPAGSKRQIRALGKGFAYTVVGDDYPAEPTILDSF